ncbi:Putative membrane protein [Gloeomargarita lithophora Alchichica-D10]|uniref:Membrane protein n=1 Tax=Gloeomargarita lithophora Alchichica-D10 TaxID=1188229 RepID=A0A1J0AE74_9CYAN|nr:bestrophin family ion channel [Gloeomargarita lithophora]APB34242.1 Putative membrane protein [Gloeomargarita lithophora Alchichica-D10]
MQLRQHWYDLTFTWRGSIVPTVLPRIILYSGIALVVVVTNSYTAGSVPFGLVTFTPDLVLGLLLVFRTNTAYDRFWEGRKAWGTMVNASRNLARQLLIMVDEHTPRDRTEKEQAVRLIIAYAITVKCHLRGQSPLAELQNLLPPDRLHLLGGMEHRPVGLAFWIGDYLRWQYQRQHLNAYQFTSLEQVLSQLVDALGVCERILRTPQPIAYSVHLRHILVLYCFFFPFRLVTQLGWGTIPATAIAAFVVLGIEEIALEIENPFGLDPNDLPLDQICGVIRHDVEGLIRLDSGHELTEVLLPTPKPMGT